MDLNTSLKKTLKGDAKACNKLAGFCKDMALVYLKSKVTSGNYYLRELNEKLEDLAWDCIADLFERDPKGHFVQLETYFDGTDLQKIAEGDLKIEIRRLVFSKVNDGVHRIYGNYDYSLHKIIRNIKYACGELNLEIKRINKSNYIIFKEDVKPKEVLMPPEFLEIKLSEQISHSMNMIEVMQIVEKIFCEQQIYSQRYPLVSVARTIREAFVKNNEKVSTHFAPQKQLFLNGELRDFLRNAISQYEKRFYETYVKNDKISESVFNAYMESIEAILSHHFIEETSYGDAYYDHLNQHLPELEKEMYRENHRQRLEYMIKLVRKDLIHRVKKEF